MVHGLPTHRRVDLSQTGEFSSCHSEAPIISPAEKSAAFADEEIPKFNTRKGSFITRRFGSARPQPTSKEDIHGPLGLRSLFCAPEALIDLVFVHGLRGGSIKTWRYGEDQHLFWPQYWLPKEPEFANASIHTFGYDSDWGSKTPSVLNVHDFGQSLYEELLTSPFLRRKSRNSPIILIGHSMGGLVIKKAYVLAQQDRNHPELSDRIRCIFFLATPHRGSDYAALLHGILKYTGMTGLTSPREYVKDLTTGSTSAQLINKDFARHMDDLTIYSFCETLPTISGSSGLIVDKASAILGLRPTHEHIQYLRANHRDICKYRSTNDSNYLIVKNALATAVENLIDDARIQSPFLWKQNETLKLQMSEVEDLLNIPYVEEENHEKLEGSCQWIEDREDFQTWSDAENKNNHTKSCRPSVFWVQANPGAGKTVLAAHVVSQLQYFQRSLASYYFHFGRKSSQTLSGLLRALAFQMASNDAVIRAKLVELRATGCSFDQDDARAVWTKVFVGGIFQVSASSPQYWVIDALDECIKYSELFTLLKGIRPHFPLHIFMTSRKLPDTPRLTRLLEDCDTTVVQIPVSDTMKDIELYIRNRIADLPIDEIEEREKLAHEILMKSDSSFLWVRLVMDELEGIYGYDSIMQVLQGIPEGMGSYYGRAVAEMGEKKREKHIAKAILLWVMLATRPLSVPELSHALQLDINTHLPSAKAAIEGLCGQLVAVDVHTGLVKPVHATASEFILSGEAEEFQISKSKGHEKIALTCLKLLVGPEMQPPRHRRLLSQKRAKTPSPVLMDYAIKQFPEHVYNSSSESDQLLQALDRFLKTTILTWIERAMADKDSHLLIRTAKNLKAYLDRQANYHSSRNRLVNNIDAWATDLSRIVYSFGRALHSNPRSIYFLVPPLCPKQSAIFQQFGQAPDGLVLSGYHQADWSDCIASIHFEEETAATVSCGNNLIAIGTESGKLDLYNSRSLQKDKTIDTNLPVELICFDPLGLFVATSSRRFVEVWEMDGTPRWKARIKSRCILLSSSQDTLIAVTQQGRSFQWDINTGKLVHENAYTYQSPHSDAHDELRAGKAPSAASLSPSHELLALVYRNSPVCIFDFSSGILIGWAVDDNNRAAEHVIFNPNPNLNLLLVAYNESHLSLYDPWSGTLLQYADAERHAIPTSVTCSSDGRTFAAMDVLGHLQMWDFESLTLIYHVLTPTHSFGMLSFTSDGLGLVQVMDHQMRVWAPSALVRKTVEEEASLCDQSPILPVSEGQFEEFHASKIETLAAHDSWPVLFAGKQNGDVTIYQASNNYEPSTLYSHSEITVRCLATRHNIIASADVHGNVQVWNLEFGLSREPTQADHMIFEAHFGSPVSQLLFDASGMYLLVSTCESGHIYSTKSGNLVRVIDFQESRSSPKRWFVVSEPNYTDHFLLLAGDIITAYSPSNSTACPVALCEVGGGCLNNAFEYSVSPLPGTLHIVVETQKPESHASSLVFTLPHWTNLAQRPPILPTASISPQLCARFLGVNASSVRMILLQPNFWVSSVDLKELEAQQYIQHFFVPEEYGALNNDARRRPVQTADGYFAFCLHDKIAVVQNGLKFQAERSLDII